MAADCTLYWMRKPDGVEISGTVCWPVRACAAGERLPRGLKGAPPTQGRAVLVMSFGDQEYIWAEKDELSPFDVSACERALQWYDDYDVRVALFQALVANRGTGPATKKARPPHCTRCFV